MTEPQPYRVAIASLYDSDERDVVRVMAYGENDVRTQVREFHPGYFVRWFVALCPGCEHEFHKLACPHQWESETTVLRCECTTFETIFEALHPEPCRDGCGGSAA